MRILKWAVATMALVALMLAGAPLPNAGSSSAFAAEGLLVIGKSKACTRVCLEGAGGSHYCGTGAGVKGCAKIINNNCVFNICPNF